VFLGLEAEKKVLKKGAKIFGSSKKSSTFAVPFAFAKERGSKQEIFEYN
jgi:hypothetical protein